MRLFSSQRYFGHCLHARAAWSSGSACVRFFRGRTYSSEAHYSKTGISLNMAQILVCLLPLKKMIWTE